MDFVVVPTATFGLLYGFFIIEHGRRKILHFNVTSKPNPDWVAQQFRKAFPYEREVTSVSIQNLFYELSISILNF